MRVPTVTESIARLKAVNEELLAVVSGIAGTVEGLLTAALPTMKFEGQADEGPQAGLPLGGDGLYLIATGGLFRRCAMGQTHALTGPSACPNCQASFGQDVARGLLDQWSAFIADRSQDNRLIVETLKAGHDALRARAAEVLTP